MPDELDPGDPLGDAAAYWREPVPIAAGLPERTAARGRRKRRALATRVAVLAGLVLLIETGIHRQASGTPVTFSIAAPTGRSVALIGDFTDWRSDQVQLVRTGSGVWHATVKLRPGRYRFAYLVDHEQWRADTGAPSAPDDFGRPTSVLTVGGK